ncbi:MAG: redox-sensing transcriptional repressor Rex [Desulfovibrio sp.]|nr:redox-sensing transcriptional repressor Rex [Desulfovibrio sp.]
MSIIHQNRIIQINRSSIKRMTTYIQALKLFDHDRLKIISSNTLAEACGVNSLQVRKDLADFGLFGIRGIGYEVHELIDGIKSKLGVYYEIPMVLIGVGNIGKAIINHIYLSHLSFNIKAIFDLDPFKIGEVVNGLEVHCINDLREIVWHLCADIGVITTPPEQTQRAAENLMDAGITSILIFAPVRIKVPENIHVEYFDFFGHLYSLAFTHNKRRPL